MRNKNKKHKFNTCPECGNIGELNIKHDAYTVYYPDENGNYSRTDYDDIAIFDNCFLECNNCGKTSRHCEFDYSEKLSELFNKIKQFQAN